jgi:25S rRNA (uracil2634-N3)-methyltransferase
MVIVSMWCGDPYDDWNIKALAKAKGFASCQAAAFNKDDYPGYKHQRTEGSAVSEAVGGGKRASRMYFFTPSTSSDNDKKKGKKGKKRAQESDDE